MTHIQNKSSVILFFLLILSFLLCSAGPVPAKEDERRTTLFNALKKSLVKDGFNADQIDTIFSHGRVAFEDKIISSYFMHQESKLNYEQFKEPAAMEKARVYMQTYEKELARAQCAFGVDKTVIVAILAVETRLGTFTGRNSIFNTLATMAALEDSDNRDVLWRENYSTLTIARKAYDEKAIRKAKWAYGELKSFLAYTEREKFNPLEINGSYAGAMGISQFMPSNALTLGVDGNDDGVVDLFTHADAIASVANYLKRYGWKPGIDRDAQYKSVYHYNHSSYYVNTVLDIADLLKG